MRDIFFVSGLPRSGSTLLVNLLAQHPKVFCTPTSGCHNLLHNIKTSWNNIIEHKADKHASSPESLKRVLTNVLYSYHDTDKPIVIDKSRSWVHDIEMIERLMGKKMKIIVPVRDISEILASFESLYRKGSHVYSALGQNTEQRVQHWISDRGEVGSAYLRLRDVFRRGLQDRLCVVEYDALTMYPDQIMKQIWDFLELYCPVHNFSSVVNQTPEDDTVYNYLGLHEIKPVVEPKPKMANIILGDDIVNQFRNYEFWRG